MARGPKKWPNKTSNKAFKALQAIRLTEYVKTKVHCPRLWRWYFSIFPIWMTEVYIKNQGATAKGSMD